MNKAVKSTPEHSTIKLNLSKLPNVYLNTFDNTVEFTVPHNPIEVFTPEFKEQILSGFGEKHGEAILEDIENNVGRAVLAQHLSRLIEFKQS